MKRLLSILAVLVATPAWGADWSTYTNARFGLTLDIPPGFIAGPEPENGDGLAWTAGRSDASLRAWGGYLVMGSYKEDIANDEGYDRDDGWNISYRAGKNTEDPATQTGWHVHSGTRDGRILYTKSMVTCKGTIVIHFRLEYPEDRKAEFNPIVKRLANSLSAGPSEACDSGQ